MRQICRTHDAMLHVLTGIADIQLECTAQNWTTQATLLTQEPDDRASIPWSALLLDTLIQRRRRVAFRRCFKQWRGQCYYSRRSRFAVFCLEARRRVQLPCAPLTNATLSDSPIAPLHLISCELTHAQGQRFADTCSPYIRLNVFT